MNEITQYIPAFVETMGEPPARIEFSTLAELEAVPFVARWTKFPAFLRLSKGGRHLMAEFGQTEEHPNGVFWVVGFIKDPAAVDLPQWVETPAQREEREAWNRGER